jgi:hypothetical protein
MVDQHRNNDNTPLNLVSQVQVWYLLTVCPSHIPRTVSTGFSLGLLHFLDENLISQQTCATSDVINVLVHSMNHGTERAQTLQASR